MNEKKIYVIKIPISGYVILKLYEKSLDNALDEARDLCDYDGWISEADDIKGEIDRDISHWIIKES